ncbi:AAA family ATPase [Candidatus Woesearchaeota archaeon]|nr:AAA family ATPase [Candidatus Woesearchaeota archaeon]
MKMLGIVGLPGSGRTTTAEYISDKGFSYIKLGKIIDDEVVRRGMKPTRESKARIRQEFIDQYGSAAYAVLNLPEIDRLREEGRDVVIDCLLSWSEYKFLKKRYMNLVLIGVFSPASTRYQRLSEAKNLTHDQAKLKDKKMIEEFDMGGPIVMADVMVLNQGDLNALYRKIDFVLEEISRP